MLLGLFLYISNNVVIHICDGAGISQWRQDVFLFNQYITIRSNMLCNRGVTKAERHSALFLGAILVTYLDKL